MVAGTLPLFIIYLLDKFFEDGFARSAGLGKSGLVVKRDIAESLDGWSSGNNLEKVGYLNKFLQYARHTLALIVLVVQLIDKFGYDGDFAFLNNASQLLTKVTLLDAHNLHQNI